LEVDLFESFGDDRAHLLVAGACVAGVEEALCVGGGVPLSLWSRSWVRMAA
jgi:hypothetical protein